MIMLDQECEQCASLLVTDGELRWCPLCDVIEVPDAEVARIEQWANRGRAVIEYPYPNVEEVK